jgi:hypothetical protein
MCSKINAIRNKNWKQNFAAITSFKYMSEACSWMKGAKMLETAQDRFLLA